MSKFLQTDVIDEKGNALLKEVLSGPFFLVQDWGVKDKYPDIDGQIRLRDGKGEYLNKYLHFQLKSVQKLKGPKFSCKKKDIKYLKETNVPTLLIVADVEGKKLHWYFARRDFQESLEGSKASFTLDLSESISAANLQELQREWLNFAKEDNYLQVSASLQKVINDFSSNVVCCVGLLYMVQKVPKSAIESIFEKLLGLSAADTQQIISKLHQEGVVTSTENLYIVENEQVGVESTFELLKKVEPEKIVEVFENTEDRKTILRRMAEIKHPKIEKFLKSVVTQASGWIASPTTNDEMFRLLEYIEEFQYRVPKEVLQMLKKLVAAAPVPPSILHKFEDKDLYGKDHEELLEKAVEMLKNIRYHQPKEIFPLLLSLSRSSSKSVCSKANDALKHFAEFNYHILRQIGYGPQVYLTDEIDKWSDKKLRLHKEVLLKMCEEFLTPSFEGTSWNKDTMTLHSGPLSAHKNLQKIRTSAINYLEKLYRSAKTVDEQKAVLNCLHNVARTPDHAGATDELLGMIYSDIERLIGFYDSILEAGAENEIVKEIEEHSYWLGVWYKDKNLKGLQELRLKIASNTAFALFSVFVGYDARIARDTGWEEAKKTREQQIQEFVADVSDATYSDWKKKILTVLKNYKPENHGEYIYLGRFLNLLGTEKPDMALRLAEDIPDKLGHWLTDMMTGVWRSNQKAAKRLMLQWVKDGKNLAVCAGVFVYGFTDEKKVLDKEIIEGVLKRAKKENDKEALRAITRAIFASYEDNKSSKKHFIDAAKHLTKIKDTWWLHGIWTRKQSILDDLTASEADTMLDALMILSNLDYHAEDIAASVAKKYPEKVIKFFLKRVASKANYRENFITSDFRAIPFDLNNLAEPLRQHQDIVVPLVLEWYGMGGKKHGWLYRWEASHFLEKIFERGTSALLTKYLTEMAKSKEKKKLEAVLSVLDNYHDGQQIWSVAKEVVKAHAKAENYEEVKASIIGAFADTGVVNGFDGLLRAYEAKREEALKFDDEGMAEVANFKKEYLEYLDRRIELEKKRVDEQAALRDRGLAW